MLQPGGRRRKKPFELVGQRGNQNLPQSNERGVTKSQLFQTPSNQLANQNQVPALVPYEPAIPNVEGQEDQMGNYRKFPVAQEFIPPPPTENQVIDSELYFWKGKEFVELCEKHVEMCSYCKEKRERARLQSRVFQEDFCFHHFSMLMQALKLFEVVAQYPNNVAPVILEKALYYKGTCLFRLRKHEESEADFRKVTEMSKSKEILTNTHLCLALVYEAMGNQELCLKSYKEYLKLNPNDINVINQIGNIFFAKQDYKKALEYYSKCCRDDYYAGFYNTALSLENLNQFKESLQYFDKAINLHPSSEKPLVSRAKVFKKLHRYEDALKDLTSAEELNGNNVSIFRLRGVIHFERGDFMKANEEFRKMFFHSPTKSEVAKFLDTFFLKMQAYHDENRNLTKKNMEVERQVEIMRHENENMKAQVQDYIEIHNRDTKKRKRTDGEHSDIARKKMKLADDDDDDEDEDDVDDFSGVGQYYMY